MQIFDFNIEWTNWEGNLRHSSLCISIIKIADLDEILYIVERIKMRLVIKIVKNSGTYIDILLISILEIFKSCKETQPKSFEKLKKRFGSMMKSLETRIIHNHLVLCMFFFLIMFFFFFNNFIYIYLVLIYEFFDYVKNVKFCCYFICNRLIQNLNS